MSEFLKGNYSLPLEDAAKAADPAKTKEEEFYEKALEKLGGSIAFVLKPKNLMWKGDKSGDDRD